MAHLMLTSYCMMKTVLPTFTKEEKTSFSVSVNKGDLSRIGAKEFKKIEFVKLNPVILCPVQHNK